LFAIAAKTWNDAQADCKADGGNLASVTSVQESAFIHILVNGKFQYWVGLSDTQVTLLYSNIIFIHSQCVHFYIIYKCIITIV
jgi:hypothetical protein